MQEQRYEGEVNQALRDARLKRNLSCEDVAIQNNLCLTTYYTYEQYSKTPSLYIAYRLAKFFDTTVEEIFPPEILRPDGRYKKERKSRALK